MTKGAEGDAGVADVGVVGQDDFEHGEVPNDGRADGGYEEQRSANEEEESAKKVDEVNFCHCEFYYLGMEREELRRKSGSIFVCLWTQPSHSSCQNRSSRFYTTVTHGQIQDYSIIR